MRTRRSPAVFEGTDGVECHFVLCGECAAGICDVAAYVCDLRGLFCGDAVVLGTCTENRVKSHETTGISSPVAADSYPVHSILAR